MTKAYCRGCDREFEVAEVKQEHLVEMVEGKRHYHPRIDTDPVEEVPNNNQS